MDYSRKRLANGFHHLLLLAALPLLTGCPPESNSTSGTGQQVESAETLYRRARAIEDRVASSESDAKANLQQARITYIQALNAHPSARLESYIRAGIGNVAFFQDDYKTASEQFATAYPNLDDPSLKSMTLLRLGMAQQRQGQFELADRTFAQLQQQFPGTTAATSARQKQGARQFYLQLAVFSQAPLADKAMENLRKEGYSPSKYPDPQGRQVIRVGPLRSYAEAVSAKNRLAGTYPGALVIP